jgi:uncharacterized protein DUF5666
MTSITRPTARRALAATASAGALLLLLSGCGGGAAAASTGAASKNTDTGAGNSNAGTGQSATRAFPGVSGQIAAVSGKTLQVQNTSSQTAVTYTDSTKLSQFVSASPADLAVGKCVQVRPVPSATSDTTSTDANTPAVAPDPTAAITAGTVAISDAVNGSCVRGFGGAGGGRNVAAGGSATGTTPGGHGGRGGVFGTVASLSGDTMTVTTMSRPVAAADSSDTSATPTTVTRTVTLDQATTYTKAAPADSSALAVGNCVTALGAPDSSGAVTATSMVIRPAVNGSCMGNRPAAASGTPAG